MLDLTGPPSGTTLTVVADQNVDKQLFATATINVPPYEVPNTWEFSVFKYITLNILTIVCIYGLKLHKLLINNSHAVQKYEGWNFNSGNYLFTTDTK